MNLKGKSPTLSSPYGTVEPAQQYIAPTVLRPPASRRAASAGAIGLSGPSSNYSDGRSGWEPSIQLPPPPPGPPPATSARSQSLCRPTEYLLAERRLDVGPRSRNHPGRATNLDTVPPTPADWREDDDSNPRTWDSGSREPQSLRVETTGISQSPYARDSVIVTDTPVDSTTSAHVRRDSAGGMLLRSPAVRNRSAKGIRERRSESRAGKSRVAEDTNGLFTMSPDALEPAPPRHPATQRRLSTRISPRGPNIRGLDETLESASGMPSAHQVSWDSLHSPRIRSIQQKRYSSSSLTPPFSPGKDVFPSPRSPQPLPQTLPPKALPTPPLQATQDVPGSLALPTSDDNRPLSSILHLPNLDVPIEVMPLTPDNGHTVVADDDRRSPVPFVDDAVRRHRVFVEREAAATTDLERVMLFREYMNEESRIRRDRYAAVFEDEHMDPTSLTADMFRPTAPSTNVAPPSQGLSSSYSQPNDSRRSSGTSLSDAHTRSRRASTTATSDQPLKLDMVGVTHGHVEPSRWNDYIPSLSPIASMSVNTGFDEMNSRGRAPSRWWESQSGSSQGDGFKVMERTKRESKYMAEARNSPAIFDVDFSARSSGQYDYTESSRAPYGPDEYPPEKTGWHEELALSPPNPATPRSAPFTPDPRKLDISRLITLPPPYPRHHPAVNNNHPDLAEFRAVVRSVLDLDEPNRVKEAYAARTKEKRERADSWCKHQRNLHSQDMQYRMEHGDISQEQFDAAEAELEAKMGQSEKSVVQLESDLFQTTVVTPLHALFSDRIARVTACFDRLRGQLSADAASPSPDVPQEEGDERPELLEQLTQLKWLFEARETLHRESFDLLSERNDRYRSVMVLPYVRGGQREKMREAEAFFVRDGRGRRRDADEAAVGRFEAFLEVLEGHVTRGVERQISAFWDIAPRLVGLLQRVPVRRGGGGGMGLRGFEVVVPRAEVEENPGYGVHSLRYLYGLVRHAEASTRQFIESQVSLWCLLQEVREGVSGARGKAGESGVLVQGGGGGGGNGDGDGDGSGIGGVVEVELEALRARRRGEERGLVEDLKERVGVVEGQWEEALGGEMRRVREGVRDWLERTGGWDEELEGL